MGTSSRLLQYLLLLATGTSWGLTNPLTKVAVSTGYGPLGLIFWQLSIILIVSGALIAVMRWRIPMSRHHLLLLFGISLVGTLIPDFLLYTAAAHIPAGILAIVNAMIPMFSLPVALLLGFERFAPLRLLGALLGMASIVLMVAPQTSLPDTAESAFVLVAVFAVVFYAMQGNFMTWYGTRGMNAVQLLFGSSLIGLVLVTPAMIASGQFVSPFVPWTGVEWAILGTGSLHGLAYTGFFVLVGRSGPVFASQVAYIVTATGVFWSILLLSEQYSGWVWSAFGLTMIGIALVQPHGRDTGAAPGATVSGAPGSGPPIVPGAGPSG